MNAPPDSAFLKQFVGAVVDWIGFARYVLHIYFENGDCISVSSPQMFGTMAEVNSCSDWTDFPLSQSHLLRVLGAMISAIYCDDQNNLWMEFSTGDVLLVAWSEQYESFEFVVDKKCTIV